MSEKAAIKIKKNGQWVAVPVIMKEKVVGAVRYDEEQNLTEEQKVRARENIGAGTGGAVEIPNSNIVNGETEGSIRGITCEVSGKYGYGVALGDNTRARGADSFAAGTRNFADGHHSVALGEATNAVGYASFTMGSGSGAYSDCACAIGMGAYAHGYAAFAEGQDTIAYGDRSHAEGIGTETHGEGQHVQGKYNIPDEEGVYAHIVGNGNPGDYITPIRSNAHTLDWDGNAWYAGTVKSAGILLTSPNGTEYIVTVNDDGTLSVASK